MNKKSAILAPVLALIAAFFVSCDDGDIYSDTVISSEGRVAKLTGTLTGISNWSGNYSVVLAGFESEGAGVYSDIQVSLSKSIEGKDTCVVMEGIPSNVTSIELSVVNTLRQRIMTLASVDVDDSDDTIRLDVGDIDVGMFSAIQKGVFTSQCAQCHGGSNYVAAGLYLTEGKSYSSLVNQTSACVTDGTRVIPGDSTNSVLHKVIDPGHAVIVDQYNHKNIITSSRVLRLIDTWIENGAAE